MTSKEYNEGYSAGITPGSQPSDNPYPSGSKQAEDWIDGYTDADPFLHESGW